MAFMLVTLDTFHFDMSPLNDAAPRNMALISATLDTFHFEIMSLKFKKAKIPLILVMAETSHSFIGPCGDVEQTPLGDSLRHSSMALVSCDWDCGENTAIVVMPAEVVVHTVCDIDPNEPKNMSVWLAFECTQAALQS